MKTPCSLVQLVEEVLLTCATCSTNTGLQLQYREPETRKKKNDSLFRCLFVEKRLGLLVYVDGNAIVYISRILLPPLTKPYIQL